VTSRAEAALEAAGTKSAQLSTMGGHPATHILGSTYYSQAPLLHGEYVAKIAVAPISANLTGLAGKEVDLSADPNAHRARIVEHFEREGGEWEVRVQLCTDLRRMPIEDASVEWPADESPYLPVARIVVPPQRGWSVMRSSAVDDGFSFSPWHGLAAHRPLGSIMRTRKLAYEMSARFRAEHNGRRVAEPRRLPEFPD
jgi:hypothetical protein